MPFKSKKKWGPIFKLVLISLQAYRPTERGRRGGCRRESKHTRLLRRPRRSYYTNRRLIVVLEAALHAGSHRWSHHVEWLLQCAASSPIKTLLGDLTAPRSACYHVISWFLQLWIWMQARLSLGVGTLRCSHKRVVPCMRDLGVNLEALTILSTNHPREYSTCRYSLSCFTLQKLTAMLHM
jgi:hypothetical protein